MTRGSRLQWIRTGAQGAHTLFFLGGVVFLNFNCITLISLCLNCCQHSMFIICILFSTFNRKHRKEYMCRNCSQTQEFYRAGTTLTDFEIPGSATDHHRGPLTLTSVAERLAVEMSLPVLRVRDAAAGNGIFPHARWTLLSTAPMRQC